MLGSVTSRNTCQPRAPRLTAATSSSAPIASMSGMSSRATTGKVTKAVARMRPGRANTTLRSCARSHGPKVPCRPKRRRRKRPTTTGETVKGRSMSAVSSVRPGKRKRAMAHAAARPKITFRLTAMGATVRVSLIECSVSGSATRLCRYAPTPPANACAKTFTSGTTTKKAMTATAARMSTSLTAGGSSCARSRAWIGFSAMVSLAPAFEEVDGEERDERDREQDDGDRRRLGVGELLEPRHDQDGRDLGPERHVARDEDDRAVLAERAREGEREAGDDRREDGREDHPQHGLQAVRAQARGGLLDVPVEALEHGLEGTDHEGEADEDQDEHDAEPRVRPLDAERHQEAAVPAPGDEQVRIDEPRDGRRKGEGQVDERVEEALEREFVAHEDPRHEDADPHVDDGRGEGRPHREAVRGQGTF